MLALCWDGRTLELDRNRPHPERRQGEALVRVRLAGICATDLQILRGYMGFTGVPGHEFVGEVVEGPEEMLGRRVVGEINFACGACDYCARALGRHCPSRRTMGIAGADGSFAEYLAIPAANLHLVADSVPDEEAVFTEPLAAAFEILEQAPVAAGEEAVVLGDGKLGLLVAQVLARAGARVRIVGKHAAKLALARRLGLEAVALERWDRRRVERVVEATGSAGGLERRCARAGRSSSRAPSPSRIESGSRRWSSTRSRSSDRVAGASSRRSRPSSGERSRSRRSSRADSLSPTAPRRPPRRGIPRASRCCSTAAR